MIEMKNKDKCHLGCLIADIGKFTKVYLDSIENDPIIDPDINSHLMDLINTLNDKKKDLKRLVKQKGWSLEEMANHCD